jgi:hypothetical protein
MCLKPMLPLPNFHLHQKQLIPVLFSIMGRAFELNAATIEKESVAPTVKIFLAILKLPVRFAKPFSPA